MANDKTGNKDLRGVSGGKTNPSPTSSDDAYAKKTAANLKQSPISAAGNSTGSTNDTSPSSTLPKGKAQLDKGAVSAAQGAGPLPRRISVAPGGKVGGAPLD